MTALKLLMKETTGPTGLAYNLFLMPELLNYTTLLKF